MLATRHLLGGCQGSRVCVAIGHVAGSLGIVHFGVVPASALRADLYHNPWTQAQARFRSQFSELNH